MMISVIVPLYNEENNIRNCLESLKKELTVKDEIIVVDNGSTDDSLKIVREFNNIKLLILNSGNIGAVRNFGAKHAEGRILAFIDSDCVVLPGWRSALLSRLKDDSIAATGSRIRVPANSPWFIKAWFSQCRQDGNISYINSANFIIKKDVFIRMKGFNQQIITGEDAEICLRLKKAGYRIVEDSKISVMHYGNPANIFSFYKQQLWHGLGMFGTFTIHKFDKPLIMTIIFGITFCVGFYDFLMGSLTPINILLIFFLLSSVPVATSAYRCYNMKSWKEFPALIALYFLYFTARFHALCWIILKSILRFQHVLLVTSTNVWWNNIRI